MLAEQVVHINENKGLMTVPCQSYHTVLRLLLHCYVEIGLSLLKFHMIYIMTC